MISSLKQAVAYPAARLPSAAIAAEATSDAQASTTTNDSDVGSLPYLDLLVIRLLQDLSRLVSLHVMYKLATRKELMFFLVGILGSAGLGCSLHALMIQFTHHVFDSGSSNVGILLH
jgi:hypothetical protein